MTPAELAAQNGHPIIPEDEAAEAFGFPVGADRRGPAGADAGRVAPADAEQTTASGR